MCITLGASTYVFKCNNKYQEITSPKYIYTLKMSNYTNLKLTTNSIWIQDIKYPCPNHLIDKDRTTFTHWSELQAHQGIWYLFNTSMNDVFECL